MFPLRLRDREKVIDLPDYDVLPSILKMHMAFYLRDSNEVLYSYFQEPNDLNPLTRVGLFFRDESLKKALSIVVSPGQATGKVDEVLELLSRLDHQLIFTRNYYFQRAPKISTARNYVFTY